MAAGLPQSAVLNSFPLTAEAGRLSRLPIFTVPNRVLIAQSDVDSSRTLAIALTRAGFGVSLVTHGRDVLTKALEGAYSLILLDSQLPGVDGLALSAQLRHHGVTTPVVFVTAVQEPEYRVGNCVVDLLTGKAARNGVRFTLTARELQLLRYLIQHRGRVISRAELLREVWGYSSMHTRTVDVHLATLRQKFEECPAKPRHLITVRRQGYLFRDDAADPFAISETRVPTQARAVPVL